MPALGYTQTIAAVRHAAKTMREEDFCRAMLNMWTRTDEKVIDWSAWVECRNPHGSIQGNVVLSVDINKARTGAAICAASRGADGLVDIELIEQEEGLGWIIPRMIDLQHRHAPYRVMVDGTGPMGALIPELERNGIPLHIVGGKELPAACGSFYDHVLERRLRIRPSDVLDSAVASAAKRVRGDAFVWQRATSTADIVALYCATLALWGVAGDPNHGAMWLY
jgi:hypothetical protein